MKCLRAITYYVLFSKENFLFLIETKFKSEEIVCLVYLAVSVDKDAHQNYIHKFMWTCENNNYRKDDDISKCDKNKSK